MEAAEDTHLLMGCDWRNQRNANNFAVVVGRVLRGLRSQRGLVQRSVTLLPLLHLFVTLIINKTTSSMHRQSSQASQQARVGANPI